MRGVHRSPVYTVQRGSNVVTHPGGMLCTLARASMNGTPIMCYWDLLSFSGHICPFRVSVQYALSNYGLNLFLKCVTNTLRGVGREGDRERGLRENDGGMKASLGLILRKN